MAASVPQLGSLPPVTTLAPPPSPNAGPQPSPRTFSPEPPPEYIDCGEKFARGCEAHGCCGTVAVAPFRFGWSTIKLVGNAAGVGLAVFDSFVEGVVSVLAGGICCTKPGKGIGYSSVDSMRTASIGVGNIASRIFLSTPCYFAQCCCSEEVATCRKENYRWLERNCCACCICKADETYRCNEKCCSSCCACRTEAEYRAAINNCCYSRAVRCLAGEEEVATNARKFAHRRLESVVNVNAQNCCCCSCC